MNHAHPSIVLVDRVTELLPELVRLLRPKHWVDPVRSERITVEQIHVLNQLDAKVPISVTDLARKLEVSIPAASMAITRLAARGLVQKVVDPADRRRRLLTVTLNGLAARRAGLMPEKGMVKRALSRIEHRERYLSLRGLAHLWRGALMGGGQPDPWPKPPPPSARTRGD